MKNILIILLFLLFTSFESHDMVRDFHVKMVGTKEVKKFEVNFPQIVSNRYVYIAYLEKYCKRDMNGYCSILIK